jgi:hypothetical protein
MLVAQDFVLLENETDKMLLGINSCKIYLSSTFSTNHNCYTPMVLNHSLLKFFQVFFITVENVASV